ncbi:MAG: fimbrial protein [Candidatus Cryptobacteroides sp.]
MRKLLIYSIMAAFTLLSCSRTPLPDSSREGTGELVIRIASPARGGTKAGTAADGDVMNNLHIWVADPYGKVVRYASWSGMDGDIVMNGGNSTATATFTNIERNTYTVYLIANKPSGLSAPAVGATIGDEFKKYVLSGFSDNAPNFGTEGMPLSLVESISISAGKNSLNAELIRSCGRIRVSVRNNTLDKNIFLQSVALGEKNPNKGYLFQQDDQSVPSGIGYTGFKDSFSYTSGTIVSDYIKPGEVKKIIDQYIYESGVDAIADMGLQFGGGVFDSSTKEAEVDYSDSYIYSAGAEIRGFYSDYIESNTGKYVIKNSNANFFLMSDGTYVRQKYYASVAELLASSNVTQYLWSFDVKGFVGSSSSSNKYGRSDVNSILNVGTGKYMYVNGSAGDNVTVSDSPTTLIVGTQTPGMLIRNSSYNILYDSTSGDGAITKAEYVNSSSDSKYYWYMYPVTGTEVSVVFKSSLKDFSKTLPNINYINDFGVAVPLTQISRNEDVNIVINIYYNPENALVYFDVQAWTDVTNETTFD